MLTGFLLNNGYNFFVSGWMQFGAAFGTAFIFMLFFGRSFINAMIHFQGRGQPISENVPDSHKKKAGTPTMGGVLILIAIFTASLLFMDLHSATAWIALLSMVMFGTIGFCDDYKKVKSQSKKASNGLSAKMRMGLEFLFVIILAYLINNTMPAYVPSFSLALPFAGIVLPMNMLFGILYFIFAYFVIAGSANAANITDGLDGMLSKIYMPVLVVLIVALYGATRIGFMDTVMFLPGASGLYPILGAVFGAVMGFLWFNGRPASIFMGDTGSLALGAFMGTVAMLLKSEIIMGIAAGMMVLILMTTMLQTLFFKLTRKLTGTGRRIFAIAPLHHLLELHGWSESKIVERFFILSILFSGFALILLKFA